MGEKEREWRKKNEYKTKFSVIVPMKNCEGFIENALNSIKNKNMKIVKHLLLMIILMMVQFKK